MREDGERSLLTVERHKREKGIVEEREGEGRIGKNVEQPSHGIKRALGESGKRPILTVEGDREWNKQKGRDLLSRGMWE